MHSHCRVGLVGLKQGKLIQKVPNAGDWASLSELVTQSNFTSILAVAFIDRSSGSTSKATSCVPKQDPNQYMTVLPSDHVSKIWKAQKPNPTKIKHEDGIILRTKRKLICMYWKGIPISVKGH